MLKWIIRVQNFRNIFVSYGYKYIILILTLVPTHISILTRIYNTYLEIVNNGFEKYIAVLISG